MSDATAARNGNGNGNGKNSSGLDIYASKLIHRSILAGVLAAVAGLINMYIDVQILKSTMQRVEASVDKLADKIP